MIIKSRNFMLRPYRKGDERTIIKNINDKDTYKYTLNIPYPYRKKDAKKWVDENINTKEKTKIRFAIDIDGDVVGGIGLESIEKHKAEIGYWLGKKYWNRGIVTEAIKIVTSFGFNNLKLKRIYAPIFKSNKASARVLEKNGFKLEGMLRKNHIKDGKYFDALLYAKVK